LYVRPLGEALVVGLGGRSGPSPHRVELLHWSLQLSFQQLSQVRSVDWQNARSHHSLVAAALNLRFQEQRLLPELQGPCEPLGSGCMPWATEWAGGTSALAAMEREERSYEPTDTQMKPTMNRKLALVGRLSRLPQESVADQMIDWSALGRNPPNPSSCQPQFYISGENPPNPRRTQTQSVQMEILNSDLAVYEWKHRNSDFVVYKWKRPTLKCHISKICYSIFKILVPKYAH
jgi:hypothetical protein